MRRAAQWLQSRYDHVSHRVYSWWIGARAPGLVVPFPHPHTIDAALANAFMGDESTEAFMLRLDAAQEENNYTRRHRNG